MNEMLLKKLEAEADEKQQKMIENRNLSSLAE